MENNIKFKKLVDFIKGCFNTKEFIPLHAPVIVGNERKYVLETIDSTFVSSVGQYVTKFENEIQNYTGSKYAIAVVNGTSALHASLLVLDVKDGDEVLTQALTFVATSNAINYTKARCVFIDVDRETMGLSPKALLNFLESEVYMDSGVPRNKATGARIAACLPMHSFGFPCEIDRIVDICNRYNIPVLEDAAESLGSKYKGRHTGTFGKIGVFSFNGNKTITTGGGGVIVTDDDELGKKLRHITTTAKLSHPWEYFHDMLGYNYRMPNINAALGCAQLEQLEKFVLLKRELADKYYNFCLDIGLKFKVESNDSRSNYWLMCLICDNEEEKQALLSYTNSMNIMTRPAWKLMSELPMYSNCQTDELTNSKWLAERIVNIPSSVISH